MKARKVSHSLLGNLEFKCSLNSVVYLPTERTLTMGAKEALVTIQLLF